MRITQIKRLTAVLLSAVCIMSFFTACNDEDLSSPNSATESAGSKKISIKDDFYTAINEDWINSTEVSQNCQWVDFGTTCQENIDKFYNSYIESLSNSDLTNEEKKLLILYEQFTEGQLEEALKKAKEYSQTIAKAETLADIERLYTDERLSLYNGLFNLELSNTKKEYVLKLTAMSIKGNNLSDSPYILEESSRNDYIELVKGMLLKCDYFDENAAYDTAQRAVDLESKVAQCFAENISENKVGSMYSPDSGFIYNMDFTNILTELGYDSEYQYVTCSDAYMTLLNDELLIDENVEDLKAYLTASTVCRIIGMSDNTSQGGTAQFNTIANFHMKDVMVNAYLKHNINDEDIKNVSKMVEEIVAVYKDKINDISYLSDDTKAKALRKIENLNVVIAQPQVNISYENADVSNDNSYITNCENCLINKRSGQNRILKIAYSKDKPIFDTMEPNAYYNVGNNSIMILAGILQSPIYNREKSFEENLGGIGTIVAHEISHSLDIAGSEYDENGDYKSWWSIEDRKAYIDRAMSLKDFVTAQGEKDGLTLNATQTKNEDIADLTAIQCCVAVLNNMDNPDYEDFFTDYAILWREKYTDDMQKYKIQYDTHSIGKYRANVPLQQIDEFYSTFGIKEGDGMYVPEEERISVW
ncbi:MAG: M13 family metallopeptidase [Acutalibacteraceae bacterium]|nr:M13 family metallopeptidase [Acutalibacteraceae bacterium]